MRSGVGAVATDLDIFAATSLPRVQVERPCLSPGLIRMSRHEACWLRNGSSSIATCARRAAAASGTLHIFNGLILNDPV
jgi:hypothetical protein